MALKLVGIGGMGLMLSPAAKHLASQGPARFIRVHDRKTLDERREACRHAWKEHGAELVSDFESLIKDGGFDGLVICAGKNGDDLQIIRSVLPLIKERCAEPPFILHLSTVSTGFAEAASQALQAQGIGYANYPLTGGPAGAEAGTMLILASGDPALYQKLEPTLQAIGNPKYFGERTSAGAEVKLIGQLMVFNGLTGISSAAALKSACFGEPISGPEQAAFFDFLNGGAGGTRQWDVALSKGVRDDVWDQGFMIQHAVVDAIYAAKLCLDKGVSNLAVMPMVATALGFAFIARNHPQDPLATHALAREMLREYASGVDAFVQDKIDYADPLASLHRAIESLPATIRDSVLLEVDAASFS
jgi:3-hydroxyisobutyrate dehydrogenase